MFLDAATVLHAQPLQYLRCMWTAMVFHDDCADDPLAAAAACSVDACIAELVSSSLVSVSDSSHEQDRPTYEDDWPYARDVQRCATTPSAAVLAMNALSIGRPAA
jgi:hypothetical protein